MTFKSYFENYKKGNIFNYYKDPFPIIDNIRKNIYENYEVDFNKLEMKEKKTEIKIIKLLKLTENRIIIITKEKNKQIWGYSTNEQVSDFNCKFVIYSIILFDIKTGEKSILFTKDIFFKLHEPYFTSLKTYIHSFDVNLINDNYIYFNICFHKEGVTCQIKEFKNEFIIYDINKKSFVKHNLIFKEFNELTKDSFNNFLSYKMRTNFYLISASDLYEFKVTKNGIEKSFIYSFNENNNIVRYFKFQDNTFYIITNNYLYIFRLKN
jgi:hypothetical protein